MSEPPHNDPPGGGRPKRFKGTLVGFRVPDGAPSREPGDEEDAPDTRVWGDPGTLRSARKQTLLGVQRPSSWPPEGPALVASTPPIATAAAIPEATATEVMIEPDRGGDGDPLDLAGPPTPRAAPAHGPAPTGAPHAATSAVHTAGGPHDGGPAHFGTPGAHPAGGPLPAGGAPDGPGGHAASHPPAATPGGYAVHPSGAPSDLPPARRYDGGSLRPEPATPVQMNAWLYRLAIFGGLAATAALATAGGSSEKIARLMVFLIWVPLVPTVLVTCVFLYKMWSAIDDQMARTTPGKAIGLLFVPLFNLYWVFEVLPGYATDYNAYLERHAVRAPRLSRNLFLAALVPGVGLFVFWYLIGRICDGVRALSH